MKTIKNILEKSGNMGYSFAKDFNEIILTHTQNYGKNKEALKSFLEDLKQGGCISGLISEFIYHSDCKDFYIKHIDDLEDFKEELEDSFGGAIPNRFNTKHYTFVVWLVFEEYCYQIYSSNFEN